MDRRNNNRGALGCLVIIIAVIVCSSTAFLTVDRICAAYLPQRLPLYPNAEIVRRSHNFLFEYGMGITTFVLRSEDDPNTVRSWYGRTTGTFLRESLESSDPITNIGRRVARVSWGVTRDNDGSTQILLATFCVN